MKMILDERGKKYILKPGAEFQSDLGIVKSDILDNAEITHSGPLGLDDFPTELTVTIALKHGMPRDSVDIQRMYTMGRTAIYGKIGKEENYNFSGFDNVSVKLLFSSTLDDITETPVSPFCPSITSNETD